MNRLRIYDGADGDSTVLGVDTALPRLFMHAEFEPFLHNRGYKVRPLEKNEPQPEEADSIHFRRIEPPLRDADVADLGSYCLLLMDDIEKNSVRGFRGAHPQLGNSVVEDRRHPEPDKVGLTAVAHSLTS